MATELVHWCDWHISDEEASRVVAKFTRTAQLDGTEYVVELCEECDVKRYAPLVAFVTTFGVDVAKEQKRAQKRPKGHGHPARHPDDDGSLVCPLCAFVAPNRQGLGAHGYQTHKLPGLFAMYAAAAEQRA